MIEAPISELPASRQFGVIGTSNCLFACPGCPASFNPEAVVMRVVGWCEDTITLVRSFRGRHVEVASGDLPADEQVIRDLREAGVRRMIVPIFGNIDEHDRRAGRPGDYLRALDLLEIAQRLKIPTMMAVVRSRRGESISYQEYDRLRRIMRLSWSLYAHLTLVDGEAPCMARLSE